MGRVSSKVQQGLITPVETAFSPKTPVFEPSGTKGKEKWEVIEKKNE